MNVAAEDAFDPFAPSDRAVSDHNAAAKTNPVEGRQLPRRRAQFDYENRNPDEVAFAANDIIVVGVISLLCSLSIHCCTRKLLYKGQPYF